MDTINGGYDQWWMCDRRDFPKTCDTCEEEKDRSKVETYEYMLEQYERYKDDKDMISEEEMKIIFDNMDKSDYTSMGRERYMDLKEIKMKVIMDKLYNKDRKLSGLKLTDSLETYPPQNSYEYAFLEKKHSKKS